jgi:hypothetical protein
MNMFNRALFFFFSVFLIFGCHGKQVVPNVEYTIKKTQQISGKYQIHFDSLRILNPFSDDKFGNYTTFYTTNDTSFLVLEDCSNRQLDVFNQSYLFFN